MRIAIGVLVIALTTVSSAKPRVALPTLTCETGDGKVSLAIEAVRVHTLIRGHLARTTYEITFRNDLDRDLDGQFSFPLPPDAEVSDIGLYFDGVLRHAVAVERVQARAAYEETVHRRVDPALAEWGASTRAFRFRVYPIPARGTKAVHLAYDQDIANAPYELDLRHGLTQTAVALTVDSDAPVERDGPAYVRVARGDSEVALAAWSASERMWYYSAPPRIRSTAAVLPPAAAVTLLYDVSSSAIQRDDDALREFLRAFLGQQRAGVRVTVVPFHVGVDPAFETDAIALDQRLRELPHAGATNLVSLLERLPAIAANAPADSRILLVTDGMHTIGDTRSLARAIDALPRFARPLAIVNASPSADDTILARLAAATGGSLADLTRTRAADAATASMRLPRRTTVTSFGHGIRQVLPESMTLAADITATLHARGLQPLSWLPVTVGDVRRDLMVRERSSDEERDLVRRSWARAALRELLERNAPAAEVLAHGLRFRQLTPHTSLLVLDTWQDYEAYGIPLPPEVRAQKARDLARYETERQRSNAPAFLLARSGGDDTDDAEFHPVGWFIRGIVTDGTGPLPGVTVEMLVDDARATTTVTDVQGRFWITARRAPPRFVLRSMLEGFEMATLSFPRGAAKGAMFELVMRVASIAESITVTAEAPAIDSAATQVSISHSASLVRPTAEALTDPLLVEIAGGGDLEERFARIAAVVERLRTLPSIDDRFRAYVAARSAIGGDKYFQAHAALALHADAPELAVRALTDLAEAWPDDAPTLRLIGRVLDGWGYGDLARLLFERALELSPRETQTWRELLLLAAKEQRTGDLRELERRFATAKRDARMEQTETALETELKRAGNDRRVDEAAELQVEVMWDTNYTDIDLHVTEPSGEVVSYQHVRSKQGGTLHDDVTSGFGPETYTLPRMESGTYEIALDYYSNDDTRLGAQALAHVIVYVRGERRDFFVALTGDGHRVVVARVTK
jgi:Ca-activated chloride channel homolog